MQRLRGNSQHAQGERELEGTLGLLKDDHKRAYGGSWDLSVMLLQGAGGRHTV